MGLFYFPVEPMSATICDIDDLPLRKDRWLEHLALSLVESILKAASGLGPEA